MQRPSTGKLTWATSQHGKEKTAEDCFNNLNLRQPFDNKLNDLLIQHFKPRLIREASDVFFSNEWRRLVFVVGKDDIQYFAEDDARKKNKHNKIEIGYFANKDVKKEIGELRLKIVEMIVNAVKYNKNPSYEGIPVFFHSLIVNYIQIFIQYKKKELARLHEIISDAEIKKNGELIQAIKEEHPFLNGFPKNIPVKNIDEPHIEKKVMAIEEHLIHIYATHRKGKYCDQDRYDIRENIIPHDSWDSIPDCLVSAVKSAIDEIEEDGENLGSTFSLLYFYKGYAFIVWAGTNPVICLKKVEKEGKNIIEALPLMWPHQPGDLNAAQIYETERIIKEEGKVDWDSIVDNKVKVSRAIGNKDCPSVINRPSVFVYKVPEDAQFIIAGHGAFAHLTMKQLESMANSSKDNCDLTEKIGRFACNSEGDITVICTGYKSGLGIGVYAGHGDRADLSKTLQAKLLPRISRTAQTEKRVYLEEENNKSIPEAIEVNVDSGPSSSKHITERRVYLDEESNKSQEAIQVNVDSKFASSKPKKLLISDLWKQPKPRSGFSRREAGYCNSICKIS